MRKSTKICLIIALGFFIVFIGCVIAGLLIGDNPFRLVSDILNGGLAFGISSESYDESFDEDYDLEEFTLIDECDASRLDSLQVMLGGGSVVVKTVDGDKCRVWVEDEEDKSQIQVSDNEGKLLIEDTDYDEKSHIFRNGVNALTQLKSINIKNIVVEIPDKQWKEIDTSVMYGASKMYDMNVDNLNVQVEAGNAFGSGKQICEQAELNVDMGNVDWEEIQGRKLGFVVNVGSLQMDKTLAETINATCEMGQMTFDSVHAENMDADCAMGDMNVTLLGKGEDYFVSYEAGMGDVDIEGGNKSSNSKADNKVNLECNMGEISVSFQKEKITGLQ